jgi:phenylacetate-CoA ligase
VTEFREVHLTIRNTMQPILKGVYHRACAVLPPSLITSDRCVEAKKYLELEEINSESEPAIRRIQSELLARTLKNALQNVPYYKKRVTIDPASIRPDNALDTLHAFPLIGRTEILENASDFVSRNVNKYLLIYMTTGGSTGRGVPLWNTLSEYQTEEAFVEAMWAPFGLTKRSRILRIGADTVAPLNGPPSQTRGRRLLVSPLHLDERLLPEIVARIDDFKPDFIHSYPSCLQTLAGHLQQMGRRLHIKGIFLASEEVLPEQLRFFSDVFDAPVHFFYGASERVLQAIGCYDGKDICYHLNPLYGIAENVRDEYGHELVGTGLWNEAMPLIRYRTEDYGKIADELTKCTICGRSWKTVHQLDGRKQYYLTTKQGTKFPGLSLDCDKFIWDHVSTFQWVQNRPGKIELHIIPRDNLTKEIEARILEAQRKRLSDWFEPITLVKQSEIPRTKAGKRRMVVVNGNPGAATNDGESPRRSY